MNERERLIQFLATIPGRAAKAGREIALPPGDLATCESLPSGGVATREWRLPAPWHPIRVPDDLFDIAPAGSEDPSRRVFQSVDGDTLQLFFLPPGLPIQRALGRDPAMPGAGLEGRCARVFGDRAIIVSR